MIYAQSGIIAPTWTHSYQNQRDSVAHPPHRCGFERTDRTQADGAVQRSVRKHPALWRLIRRAVGRLNSAI